ncbi:hypothetical protein SLEP1_g2757 [Rubroshorea leprosula]|uniref:Uncharacterized protein n=1 Tax=Rubroshorea leprosula TaxID=152421 RepID=A0AAV5HIM1_9ROSI|nr:hypothetical protein SLEP1_g2757 [Rubroshorea leprosula]
MAVAAASSETIDPPSVMDRSPSQSPSDGAAEPSNLSCSAGTPDRNEPSNSSPNPNRDVDVQVLLVSLSFILFIYIYES